MAEKERLVTYYNGSCPICRAEIMHYRRKSIAGLTWRDISGDDVALQELGVSREAAKRRLHVRLSDGRIVSGVSAFVAIWREMNGLKWLAWLVDSRLVRPPAEFIYDRILAPLLFWWNRRNGR